MLGMTGDTGHLGMLAFAASPNPINSGMATGAGLELDITLEGDLQRLVHRMTGGATLKRLLFIVTLMTNEAGRDKSVLIMTGRTPLQSMFAGELLQLSCRRGVTVSTILGQAIGHDHIERRMRVSVTGQTFGLLRPMGLRVAARTLGHNIRPVILVRIIGMKLLVTVLAIKLVTSPILLDGIKVGRVAGTALGYGHFPKLNIIGIGRGFNNRRFRYGNRYRRNYRSDRGHSFDFRRCHDSGFSNRLHASGHK